MQAQSDFIQDFSEREHLASHLLEMFGERAENSPPWDHERRYSLGRLAVYAPFQHHETNKPSYVRIRVEEPLMPQLKKAQAIGYEIPGVPTLQVVVQESVYEKHFVLPKIAQL